MTTGMRLFLAVDPPAETVAQARRIIARLTRAGIDATWVDPGSLHLTLHFLGNDVAPSQVPAIASAVDHVCEQTMSFDVVFGGLGTFPDTRNPRIIWLGVLQGAESLARLQASLCAAIGPLGFPAEARGFHPHLTLGRLRPTGRRRDRPAGQGIAAEAARLSDEAKGTLPVREVVLYASRLEPAGPCHTRLHAARLGTPSAAPGTVKA
ncbi:MAG: RNA 2',3'-cyclic phosphodiesterase, partial [Planctomycetia bacterium]